MVGRSVWRLATCKGSGQPRSKLLEACWQCGRCGGAEATKHAALGLLLAQVTPGDVVAAALCTIECCGGCMAADRVDVGQAADLAATVCIATPAERTREFDMYTCSQGSQRLNCITSVVCSCSTPGRVPRLSFPHGSLEACVMKSGQRQCSK